MFNTGTHLHRLATACYNVITERNPKNQLVKECSYEYAPFITTLIMHRPTYLHFCDESTTCYKRFVVRIYFATSCLCLIGEKNSVNKG